MYVCIYILYTLTHIIIQYYIIHMIYIFHWLNTTSFYPKTEGAPLGIWPISLGWSVKVALSQSEWYAIELLQSSCTVIFIVIVIVVDDRVHILFECVMWVILQLPLVLLLGSSTTLPFRAWSSTIPAIAQDQLRMLECATLDAARSYLWIWGFP